MQGTASGACSPERMPGSAGTGANHRFALSQWLDDASPAQGVQPVSSPARSPYPTGYRPHSSSKCGPSGNRAQSPPQVIATSSSAAARFIAAPSVL